MWCPLSINASTFEPSHRRNSSVAPITRQYLWRASLLHHANIPLAFADRAVLPEPRTKNTSSSDNPNSPLSPYFIKKKRDWTLTHSDEDIRRYRELCSRTVNRCPLQEMPDYPPTYPAAAHRRW